jgi:hypothetical protein
MGHKEYCLAGIAQRVTGTWIKRPPVAVAADGQLIAPSLGMEAMTLERQWKSNALQILF